MDILFWVSRWWKNASQIFKFSTCCSVSPSTEIFIVLGCLPIFMTFAFLVFIFMPYFFTTLFVSSKIFCKPFSMLAVIAWSSTYRTDCTNSPSTHIPYLSNPTLSEFDEIWHTCCFFPSNLKFFTDWMISFWNMGVIFLKNWENKRGRLTSNYHIFWTSGSIT